MLAGIRRSVPLMRAPFIEIIITKSTKIIINNEHFAGRDQEKCPLNRVVPLIEVITTKIICALCQPGPGEMSS